MDELAATEVPPFNDRLIARFNEPSPYYSSYPSLNRWREGVGDEQYRDAIRDFLSGQPAAPLYLYVHIPFCAKLCYYCICNIQITDKRERIQRFVDALCAEIDLLRRFFDEHGLKPDFREIHLGGGTPSHLDHQQLRQLIDSLAGVADIPSLDEFAMEIDPRTVSEKDLLYYKSLGVDRISFGVQDFDKTVQESINRVQPFEMVRDLLSPTVRKAFKGVNFDLLFGLPMQTLETFRNTVALTNELSPERITLIKYAHAPHVRKHMRMINADEMPPGPDLPILYREAVESFTDAGYQWAGISGLAKTDDDLGRAVIYGTVGRNFSGPSPGRADNIIGVGPTTTAAFGDYYFQSAYDVQEYYQAVEAGRFPISKGYVLNAEDRLRRDVVFGFQCSQMVDLDALGRVHEIDAARHFAAELEGLKPLVDDGLVEVENNVVRLTPLGRYFTPQVCSVFDGFLKDEAGYVVHGP